MTRRHKRNRKNQKDRSQQTQARLSMENLEPRQLMTATPVMGPLAQVNLNNSNPTGHLPPQKAAVVSQIANSKFSRNQVTNPLHVSIRQQGSELRITGTSYDDFVEVSQPDQEHVKVTVYKDQARKTVRSTKTFNRSDVTSLVFDGQAGDDYLWNGQEWPLTTYHLEQHSLPTTAYGGTGNDHLEGSNVDDFLYGGPGDDTIYGNAGVDKIKGDADPLRPSPSTMPDGDDVLNGGSGTDTLWGEGGDDTLRGGLDSDWLFGNTGNDSLYGEDGNDRLFGQKGIDGLYGGNGFDYLTGGNGSDRFLYQDGDKIYDKTGVDARIDFEDGKRDESRNLTAGNWDQGEIELIDIALRDLHMKTKDDTLLETKKGMRLRFRRLGAPIDTAVDTFDGSNNKSQRRLRFADSAFGDTDYLVRTVFHEMGHNWDKEHGSLSTWKNLSGWTKWKKHDPAYQTSLNGNWRHRRNANFVSDYAKNVPEDDFADTFAAIFMDARGGHFDDDITGGHDDNKAFDPDGDVNIKDIGDLHGKRNHINNWLDGLTS
jgi:hypothetical protein